MTISEICQHSFVATSCQICPLEATVLTLTESLRKAERERDYAKAQVEQLGKNAAAGEKECRRLVDELSEDKDDITDLRNALCGILYIAHTARLSGYVDMELPAKIVAASKRALDKKQWPIMY